MKLKVREDSPAKHLKDIGVPTLSAALRNLLRWESFSMVI